MGISDIGLMCMACQLRAWVRDSSEQGNGTLLCERQSVHEAWKSVENSVFDEAQYIESELRMSEDASVVLVDGVRRRVFVIDL